MSDYSLAMSGTFPTISDDDLIQFSVDLTGRAREDIPLTLNAIKKPTMESTMAIFQFFMQEIISLQIEPAIQVPFELVAKVQYWEMHQEQSRVSRFYGFLQEFFAQIHYDSFNIDDLFNPRPVRLRRQLSALANFVLFTQGMSDDYGEVVMEEHANRKLRQQNAVKENMNLKSNVHQQMQLAEELKLSIEEKQQRFAEATRELVALQEDKDQQQQELRQGKAAVSRLQDRIQDVQVRETKLQEEKHSLEALVVGSPDKVRQTLTHANQQLQAMEDQRQALSSRHTQLLHMRDDFNQLKEEQDKFRQHLDTLNDQAEKHSKSTLKLKEMASQMDQMRVDVDQVNTNNRQMRDQCDIIEEGRETGMLKSAGYLEAKREELEKSEQQLERTRAQLAGDQPESEELATETAQEERRSQEERDQHEAALAQLQRQQQHILAACKKAKRNAIANAENTMKMIKK